MMPEHRSEPRYRNLDATLILILTFRRMRAARWSNGWLDDAQIQLGDLRSQMCRFTR